MGYVHLLHLRRIDAINSVDAVQLLLLSVDKF